MSLPGKLCIGILEEDNPLKSFFRFKPLLVEVNGQYEPYTETDTYPEEGCIRIVPDKNESYHFKTRMRRIGLFCVVDLRNHPEGNDKIRPNKNYHEGSTERNAFIIYSDVVREPVSGMIFEILPEAASGAPHSCPRTAEVLLRGETLNPERYEWTFDADRADQVRIMPTGKQLDLEGAQTFDLIGFKDEELSFAILPPGGLERICDAPESRPATVERPMPVAPTPSEAAAPEASKPVAADEAPAEKPADASAHPTEAGSSSSARPAPSVTIDAPEAMPAVSHPRPADKPWIHRDASMLPRPVDPRLSPAQRNLAAQSGMNPRRGRSLQELIDEKWQQSRLNQLGQPVSPIQTGAPVSSPVDNAVSAVRDVWNQPHLRRGLLDALGSIEEFGASLEECREAARQRDIEQHLEGLEARRLALLGELDHLTLKNEETRQSLKQELKREQSGDLAEAVRRTQAAQAEQHKYEALAEQARAAAQDARKAVDTLTDDEMERRLREFALSGHMLERIRLIKGEEAAIPPAAPEVAPTDLNAAAARLTARYEAEGYQLTRVEALNLCACAAVSPVLMLSGPVGSGKTEAARLLSEALGWTAVDRFVRFCPGKGSLEADARVAALKEQPETPAMLLLDDANLHPSPDPLRGLAALGQPQWRLCLTLQDGGAPLAAYALDRGFMVRLSPRRDIPWKPRARTVFEPQPPVSLCLDIPDIALPAAVEERMEALREMLSRRGAPVSRRALNDMWRYCALMLDTLGEHADGLRVLDRAVAQRLMPTLLASAPIGTLRQLPALLEDMPISRALLRQPLPVMI